ncbi:acyltransferase [Geomonas sp. Red276]
MKYMCQLDSLRTFAVFAVMMQHFKLFDESLRLETGSMGVHLFFVLSGYLITSILLKNREEVDRGVASTNGKLFEFYVRRSLRIFPVYYFTIVIVYMLNATNARDSVWWNVLYLSNIKAAIAGSWPESHVIPHFWSLCVEEQFYLFWPWFILFIPKKYLEKGIWALIGLAPLLRFMVSVALPPDKGLASYTMTPCCFDFLGFGGLLAFYSLPAKENTKQALMRFGVYAGLPLFILLFIAKKYLGVAPYFTFLDGTFEAMFYVWVIGKTSVGVSGFVGDILNFKPFVNIGKVSYGIYLFHPFVGGFVNKIIKLKFGVGHDHGAVFFVVCSALTIVVATISWLLFEKRINDLKSRIGRTANATVNTNAAYDVSG